MTDDSLQPIPLSDDGTPVDLASDSRSRMPEPLPVKLVTVADAALIGANGLEKHLDAFYVKLLGFERDASTAELIYRAENFRIVFALIEPPVSRDDMRPLGIEVLSLPLAEQKLIDAEIEYVRQKALTPGNESLLLQDPAGNWIELTEAGMVR